MKAVLHADGGARGNPGPAGIGVVLEDGSGRILGEIAEGIGRATNNVAEYRALIAGLQLARELGVSELEVWMDSQLVVAQVMGEWKIKSPSLRSLAVEARALLSKFSKFSLKHVSRELNADADKLANKGMDASALDDDDEPVSQRFTLPD